MTDRKKRALLLKDAMRPVELANQGAGTFHLSLIISHLEFSDLFSCSSSFSCCFVLSRGSSPDLAEQTIHETTRSNPKRDQKITK
jgi:hypothetical protein